MNEIEMRGAILCGGKGTRLLPQTQIHNKHLLPVYTDHQGAIPMIWYPLYTLIRSGIKKILIISSQEHCGDIIQFLGDGRKFGSDVELTYKIQDHNDPTRPVGIAGAMKLIEDFVTGPFAVILGDNFFEDDFSKEFSEFKARCQNTMFSSNYNDCSFAHTFLKEVEDPHRFGVATMNDGKITKIVEKPKIPESNLAVTGLYLFNKLVFPLLETLKVSARGELEVSEINNTYVEMGAMTATTMKGYWTDLGIPSSMHRGIDYINDVKFTINWK